MIYTMYAMYVKLFAWLFQEATLMDAYFFQRQFQSCCRSPMATHKFFHAQQ